MLETECIMKKVEHSVRITFGIPKDAANRLKQLAQQNDDQLQRLGILSVQVEGEDTVRLPTGTNIEGNIHQVIAQQQPAQVPLSSALIQSSCDISNAGDGPHEFDTILSQLTASGLRPGTTSADHNVFVVPQPTAKKRPRGKSKDKGAAKANANAVLNVIPNGPSNSNTINASSQELAARMEATSATDSLSDLGDMRHLDFSDLIGADGSLDSLEIGGKNYAHTMDEMVTDILHMDGMGPQHNLTLGMSPTSLNSNQVQSQMDGVIGNSSQQLENLSDHNAHEVDELLKQLKSFDRDDEQSTSHLNPSIGDLPYSQDSDAFPNVSAPPHVIQRQMSYPLYSSKQTPLQGPNQQTIFTATSGRQSVGPINSGLSSPHHTQHLMQTSMTASDPNIHMQAIISQKGNLISGHQPDMSGKMFPVNQTMEKELISQGFPPGFNPNMGPRNPEMTMGMQKLGNRPPSANMLQPGMGNNWKMPAGAAPPVQHTQHNTMHHSPGMTSPKPINMIAMSSAAGYSQATTPTKRVYPSGPSSGSQYDPQISTTGSDHSKTLGMSNASPLLVNLLQTSSSTTMAGSSGMAQTGSQQLAGAVGEPPKPKRKKPTRKKKAPKMSYPPTPDQPMIPGTTMMPGPGMPGPMPSHMSPQHSGVRMQHTQYGHQYVMQQVNSTGQYFHPHATSSLPQMHGGIADSQKSLYGPYSNGTNMPSPGLHPLANKASPSHVFSPEQKTAFIETINRSDVGSRMATSTPTQLGQQRVPTPGHSPSGHGHITPNHMPPSSVGPVYMGNTSSTVHHGPRTPGMNGMQHPQMQNRMQSPPRMQQQVMAGVHSGPNMRISGPSAGMQNSQMMAQQFPMQGQFHQSNPPFQSPPINVHGNAPQMYQVGVKQKQPSVMASPSSLSNEYLQDAPPPNVVINGSDSLQQAIATQRQITGFQKRVISGEVGMMMHNDGGVQSPGTYFHQQASSSPGHMTMKTQNNPNMYHNPAAQIPVAGPNNFNNSNNLDASTVMPSAGNWSQMAAGPGPGVDGMSDATVTHYPMGLRPKMGVLDSGEFSVILKGTCTSPSAYSAQRSFPALDTVPQKIPRMSKKSPGSATDGHSSSPGSAHSHTPSPAGVKRSMSTSNPPTPLHLDPMGSPMSMTMQSHSSSSRSTTPRQKSGCTTPRSGTPVGATSAQGRRVSADRQVTFPGSAQRGPNQGPLTSSPVTPNGPGPLNRPASRTDTSQHHMTPPGTPGQSRHTFQNPPAYPLGPGIPSALASGQDNATPSGSTTPVYGSMPPSYHPRDNNLPSQQQHLNHGPHDVPPKSPWDRQTLNHHPSPSQIHSPSNFEESNWSQTTQHSKLQQNMPNSLGSHVVSSRKTDYSTQNCSVNTAVARISPQSTELSPSSCTTITDSSQTPHALDNSPNFFKNQTQDLLTSSKSKNKQENSSAPTVPLQS